MWLFCCSGRISRLSLNQHSLYVGVVENPLPPPRTGKQYGQMEPKYHEGGHCQSVLRPQVFFWRPPLFEIFQWRRQRHLTWSPTHDVVSREINLWKRFDLLRGANLWPLAPSAGCLTVRPPELTRSVVIWDIEIYCGLFLNLPLNWLRTPYKTPRFLSFRYKM